MTVFGTPLDVTLSELAIESFFPADASDCHRTLRHDRRRQARRLILLRRRRLPLAAPLDAELPLAPDDEDAGADDDRAADQHMDGRHVAEEQIADEKPRIIEVYSNGATVEASAWR